MAGPVGFLVLLHSALAAQDPGPDLKSKPVLKAIQPAAPAQRDSSGDEAAVKQYEAQLVNTNLPAAQRVEAARQWLARDDQPATVQKVLGQITLMSLPAVTSGLLNVLAESRRLETAGAILGCRTNFTPAARLTAVRVLLRRPEWLGAVIESVERGDLARTEIPLELWQELARHTDPALAARARKLADYKPASSSPEMAALAKKLMPAADQRGDLKRGKELYDQLCLVCHTLNGQGGKAGPDLTGYNVRPRSEILLDIIDSNRSVDANFRLWTITTKGEDAYSGKLETEAETTIEILDLTGQKHTVQRKDVARIEVSQLSIMPVGFEALPVNDLAALLDYIYAPAPAPKP